jgi:hypothetical protein
MQDGGGLNIGTDRKWTSGNDSANKPLWAEQSDSASRLGQSSYVLTKFRGSSYGCVNTDTLHLSRYLTPFLRSVSLSREKLLLAPSCLSVFCQLVLVLLLLEEIYRNLILGTFKKTCRETPHFVEIRQKCRAI